MPKSPVLSKKQPQKSGNEVHTSTLPVQSHDEAQVEEIEVLRSIYGDDFSDVETKKAWSKAIERSFKVKLRSNVDGEVSVSLFVTLTSTYPKSVPLVSLEDFGGVRQNALTRIQSVIAAKPKELIGEVMIFEIASAVQEVLDEEVSARARDSQLPSLEEERAEKEAAQNEARRQGEEKKLQLEEKARVMEELDAQRRLEDEVRKREDAKLKRKSMDKPVEDATSLIYYEQVHFDQAVSFKDELRNQHHFTSVYLFRTLAQSAAGTIYTATPPTPQPQSMCFVLKRSRRIMLCSKEVVLRFENLMEGLLKLNHHANIVNVLAFKLTPEDKLWQCDILTDFATRGSLAEMLDMVGEIPASKARSYIKELLQALEYYHKHRIVHGRIHAGNILFTSLHAGIVSVKLADAGFAAFLQDECSQTKINARRTTSGWLAPELQKSANESRTYKTDIWDFGVVLVQMLLGSEIKKTYSSPSKVIEDAGISSPLIDLLDKVFHADHRKRPNPFELITFEFLRTDCSVLDSETSEPRRRPTSSAQVAASTPRRFLRSESSNAPVIVSRYLQEWEQIGRLGKGGYGEVVKARNKLDGQIYAVKKVSNKSPSDLNQVLSEVYLLATLNHPYVVRYFVGWAEADEDVSVDESSYAESSTGDGIVFGNSSDDSDDSNIDPMTQSTGGLDFMSASFPNIEFAEDDVEGHVDEDEESDSALYSSDESHSDSGPPTTGHMSKPSVSSKSKSMRAKSFSKVAVRSTLYIQMEYCERLTLRDMIRKGFHDRADDMWRLFRQILEGLVHIHSHGIIHRDLKPENVS
jgi:translation initiation factor 2-alpha kinase 4